MKKKKIVIGICGSVAAIESVKLIRELVRKGFSVECVMTRAAKRILHPYVLEWASENKVIDRITGGIEHVRLCGLKGEASMLVIYPATSNTISKIAHGIDDTPVTTFAATALGSGMPVLIAPAMHQSMYKNPFVAESLEKLKKLKNVRIIDPRIEDDKAKVAANEDILKEIMG